MSGIGTLSSPWSVKTALAASQISNSSKSERTLWIKDGQTSDIDSVISLNGANGRLITIRPYQSGNPKLNGNLSFNGSYWVLRDVELFWNGWTTRASAQSGSNPTDITMKNLVGLSGGNNGSYIKLVNCVIHDLSGPFFDDYMLGTELYGCVIYHIGWNAPDRGHGHGLYLHNISPVKTIKDCIIFDNFGWGMHAYSPNASNLKNFIFEGNTCFRNGSLSAQANPDMILGADIGQADTASFIGNMTYGGSIGLQFYGAGTINMTLTNNYHPNGKIGTYSAISETGNYWGPSIGNEVFLRANDYDSNRANLTIYNESAASSINVNVSGVFSVGDIILVRNVQDYFVDIQNLTVAADGTITINMLASSRTVSTPVQWTAPATTFPQFGCFVLEKQ